jgi:hypothetical protein
MARLRYNGLKTTLGGALTAVDTTVTFAAALTHSAGTAVPTIVAPDYVPLTLTDAAGLREVVHLTSYTTGATTGTILRAQEATTAQTHESGATVLHSATVEDFVKSLGLFRGEWAPETLAYSEDFTAGTFGPEFTRTNAGSGALPAIVNAPAGGPVEYTKAVKLAVVNTTAGNSSTLSLDLGALDLQSASSRVVCWVVKPDSGFGDQVKASIAVDAVEVFASTSPHVLAWQERTLTEVGTTSVVDFIAAALFGGNSTTADFYVTGIEVYVASDPYMLGEYVVHEGKLWKSDSDNNSGTPGTAGWTEVPLATDTEAVRDTIGSTLVAGSGVTITSDDTANTITVAADGGSGDSIVPTGARVYRSAALSITSGVGTALLFDTEAHDTHAFHDQVTNPERLTVPAGLAGLYLIEGGIRWSGNDTGLRGADIKVNGTTVVASSGIPKASAAEPVSNTATATVQLVAGDYVTLEAFQNSGSGLAIDVSGGTQATHLSLTRVADGASATPRIINAQTGTSYTLALADAGDFVTMDNAAASTLTVPDNATVAFPVGTTIEGAQLGVGQVTITPAAGVTVNGAPGLKLADQYATFGLLKLATDTWLAYGRLSA